MWTRAKIANNFLRKSFAFFYGDSEQQIRYWSIPVLLIFIYYDYYVLYYNKRILKEGDTEGNG
jgi:hypothetical protein